MFGSPADMAALDDRQTQDAPGEIALSLSGGGTRALGFHLGTMDYLNRIGWLDRVTILSSVSGGSLPAIGYALTKKRQESFEVFYQGIFEFFPMLNTVGDILENLSLQKPVVASGRRNLITSWAEVYRQTYFKPYLDEPTFDIFWTGPKTHLKEVIFNAVEFKTGVAFRFQHSDHTNGYRIGNGNVWLDHDYARKLRMSDIMASSSCIPGGMEPLQFPRDYHWPDDEWSANGPISRKTCDAVCKEMQRKFGEDAGNIAIIDGGVYDNQTISSVLLALARAHRKPDGGSDDLGDKEPAVHSNKWRSWFGKVVEHYLDNADTDRLDLYIVSDVPLRHDPMYQIDPDNSVPALDTSWFRRRTMSQVNNAVWVISLLLLLSAAINFGDFLVAENLWPFEWQRFLSVGVRATLSNILSTLIPGIVALALLVPLLVARRWLGKKLAAAAAAMPGPKRPWLPMISNLTIGNIVDMITARATSLSALVTRFYMHRTRQLEYDAVYGNKALAGKILPNEIYRLLDPPEGIEVSANLRTVVEVAASMPTKIWINQFNSADDPPILRGKDDLQVLVAAGQATIIANLMCRESGNTDLGKTLGLDWQRMNEDPFYFVDNR